jgi:hypothetical protein
MIVTMLGSAEPADIQAVVAKAQGLGFKCNTSPLSGSTMVSIFDYQLSVPPSKEVFSGMAGVDRVYEIKVGSPFALPGA